MAHADLTNQPIDCCVVGVGLGPAEAEGHSTRAQTLLKQQHGPLFAMLTMGIHADGSHCEVLRLIGWEPLAELYGMTAALLETLPTGVRDQFRAHAHATTVYTRAEIAEPHG